MRAGTTSCTAAACALGEGSVAPRAAASDPTDSPVRYRPCAVCGELMNRFNFANCSGVILDSCKPHGVWFDPDELRRIVEFIRGGGLDMARDKERVSLELERRRLAQADAYLEMRPSDLRSPVPDSIAATRDLLRFLFDK